MRRPLVTAIALLSILHVAAAQIDTLWTRVVEHDGYLDFVDGVPRPDEGFTICGNVLDGSGLFDIGVFEFDNDGNQIAALSYGGTNSQQVKAAARFGDGTLLVLATDARVTNPATSLALMAFGEQGDSLWTLYLPQVYSYQSFDVAPCPDGSVVVTAEIQAEQDEWRDIWIAKFNSEGDSLWSRIHSLMDTDYPEALAVDEENSIFVAGHGFESGLANASLFILKLAADGSFEWVEYPEIDDNYRVSDLQLSPDGNLFLAGSVLHAFEMTSFLAVKLSPAANVVWYQDEIETAVSAYFYGVIPREDGGADYLGTLSSDLGESPILLSLDPNGDEIARWHDVHRRGWFNRAVRSIDNEYLACGTLVVSGAERAGQLALFNPLTRLTGTVYETGTVNPLEGVRVEIPALAVHDSTDAFGHYEISFRADTVTIVFSGLCVESAVFENAPLIVGEENEIDFELGVPRYDQNPSSINIAVHYDIADTATVTLSNIGSGGFEFFAEALTLSPTYNWLDVSPSEGALAAGASEDILLLIHPDSQHGPQDEFLGSVVIRSRTCPDSLHEIPVNVIALDADTPPSVASEFRLHPAFPNPFNAATTLRFDLARSGRVGLDVFDLTGRMAKSTVPAFYPAGTHSIRFDMNDSASGVYLLRLRSETSSAVQKLVLIK